MQAISPDCTALQDILARQASRQPAAVALVWRGENITYGELQARVERLAGRIAATGRPGDRVAVLAWNCPEFIELIYAVPAAGRILVPLNARLAPAELCWQLRHAGATRLFADPALLAPLAAHADFPEGLETVTLGEDYLRWVGQDPRSNPPASSAADPAWILFTSGSTGRPKGAVLTHHSFLAGLESAAMGRPVLPGDRYFYPFPLFHVAAHNVLLQHLFGAAVVLAAAFDAGETLLACREGGVTTLSLAPTMIAMLMDHPEFRPADLCGVRTIGYGASAMPGPLLQRLLGETAVGLCQSYGMTELSGSVAFLTVDDHRRAAGERPELLESVGRPLPTASVRLSDSGEILVRAGQCMAGYWNDEAATRAALGEGWLHTGDIGRFDAEGYLYIVDRKKDMIISGGENIASREVEEVLRRHPAVKDCAVIGLPDPRWGERVCAVLQLVASDSKQEPAEGLERVSDETLHAHCREYLAGYKAPRRFERVEALPVNAGGKVDKPLLRRRFSG